MVRRAAPNFNGKTDILRSITPQVCEATKKIMQTGLGVIRNQTVLLRGVNDSPSSVLDLCFALLDEARITPYYCYMCDLIPHAEHWRLPLHRAQSIQSEIMGYLPGFATPRVVCDVPGLGKRWVHQVDSYDRIRGISYWTKNYWTPVDSSDAESAQYVYFDPIPGLPEDGQRYWASRSESSDVISIKEIASARRLKD
jgi:lysine 2,3-aminomutase